MLQPHYFLRLNPKHIQFDRVSEPSDNSSVFYDSGTGQIFVVRRKGEDEVRVHGPEPGDEMVFGLENKGDIQSIKFSTAHSILAVQRADDRVDFVNFKNGKPGTEYSFSCKTRNCRVLGFCWTSGTEVVVVTNLGIELCQVTPGTRTVKCLRVQSISICWFVYHPRSCFLVASMGSGGNVLQPLQFSSGTLYKYTKFEVDVGRRNDRSRILSERDVCLTTLYGHLTLLVLKHEDQDSRGSQFVIYTFRKDCPPKVTHILELELTGRFAVNIVDNLILVHHQTSQTSLIFDVKSIRNRAEDNISRFKTLIPPHPIEPFVGADGNAIEMYSSRWAVFQPNVIIDTHVGCLWRVEISLESISKVLSVSSELVDFLTLRHGSKPMLRDIVRQAFEGQLISSNSHILGTLTMIFNKLNRALKRSETKKSTPECSITTMDQADMFQNVFCCMDSSKTPPGFTAAVLFEYIHSLGLNEIVIEHSTYELLIKHLIEYRMVYQLQQFLQYHVFHDSKPLACLLLSLQGFCRNATQLAVDMFKRLKVANEDMIDVYLSVNSHMSVLRALRYVQKQDALDSVSARKFLEVARNSMNEKNFFVVYKLFQLRNLKARGSTDFAEGLYCLSLVDHVIICFCYLQQVNSATSSWKVLSKSFLLLRPLILSRTGTVETANFRKSIF